MVPTSGVAPRTTHVSEQNPTTTEPIPTSDDDGDGLPLTGAQLAAIVTAGGAAVATGRALLSASRYGSSQHEDPDHDAHDDAGSETGGD